MREATRFGNVQVKNLSVTGTLTVGGQPVSSASEPIANSAPTATVSSPSLAGGLVSVTGSGQIASGLTTVSAVSASLASDVSASASAVAVTATGGTITFKVYRPDGSLAVDPALVNWIALGS